MLGKESSSSSHIIYFLILWGYVVWVVPHCFLDFSPSQQSHKTRVVWEIAWIRIVIASVGPLPPLCMTSPPTFYFASCQNRRKGGIRINIVTGVFTALRGTVRQWEGEREDSDTDTRILRGFKSRGQEEICPSAAYNLQLDMTSTTAILITDLGQ